MSAIRLEKRGHQAWITLDRPEAKNILNGEAFPAGRYRVEAGPEIEFVAP